jgi:hypothetical protein
MNPQRLARPLLIACLCASSWAQAAPPPASSVFRQPAVAAMADSLAKGDPNGAMLGISQGASVNAKGLLGATPLHYVVSYAHDQSLGSLRSLLNAGADPNAAMDNGMTPLGLAASRSTPDALAILLGARARPSQRSGSRLPLQIAMDAGVRKNFEILAISGSPLTGPAYGQGSAAEDLARMGRHDWLLWLAARRMVAAKDLAPSFWSAVCQSSSPDASAAAKLLGSQPKAQGCRR